MTDEKITAVINAVFVEQFELDPAELTPEKEIFTDLGLDSLDIVDLVIALQRKFGISLRDNEEIKQVRTLGDVYDFFEKNQAMLTAQAEAAKAAAKATQQESK